ncbi:hypothetical protein DRO59_03175 [Candidatus Bathyarchaeota archaeon]|nr:MAG: hypothetical protein DRO59_03175 [Candidatus Bathyarchaeota archaeon]
MKIVFDALLGLLVLVWMLLGVCVVAIGVHVVIVWVGLSYKTLIYSFTALSAFVFLLDLVLRLIKRLTRGK